MFSFLPQLFIVAALAGIIIVVLRRTPEITTLPVPALLKNAAKKFWELLKVGAKKLWHYTLEAKELSKKGVSLAHFPESFRRINFSLPPRRLPFFASTDSPEFYLRQAEEHLTASNFAEAERCFIKVVEKDAGSEAAFAGLGRLYVAQEKFAEAAETYNFLLKHYPESDSYHASLGQVRHNQKLYDQAVEAYEKAIELAPSNAKRYVNLGLTLEAKKHLEEAILNYRKALDLEKDNSQFLMILSEVLVRTGEKDEAQVLLERILVLEPTNHLAREKLMHLKF